MNTAIILSGGTGSRIKNEDIPKQYIRVCDKPVIWYVLQVVIRCGKIFRCVIVAGEKWHDLIEKQFEDITIQTGRTDMELIFAEPGETRQISILNGLAVLEGNMPDEDVVAVIDACRPNMTTGLLKGVIETAERFDGAIPVLPMKDTVYLSKDGNSISGLLNRNEVFAGQAPEAFKYGKYLDATRALLPEKIMNIHGSTEPAILAGMDIQMVGGDEHNYKITTDEDLKRFREECELGQDM